MLTTPQPKVFAIGFKKTGTTTIASVFERLGLPEMPRRADVVELWKKNDTEGVLRAAAKHRAFQDAPWCAASPPLYRAVASRYPDAKFILTVREPEAWWHSRFRVAPCPAPCLARKPQRTGLARTQRRRFPRTGGAQSTRG